MEANNFIEDIINEELAEGVNTDIIVHTDAGTNLIDRGHD